MDPGNVQAWWLYQHWQALGTPEVPLQLIDIDRVTGGRELLLEQLATLKAEDTAWRKLKEQEMQQRTQKA